MGNYLHPSKPSGTISESGGRTQASDCKGAARISIAEVIGKWVCIQFAYEPCKQERGVNFLPDKITGKRNRGPEVGTGSGSSAINRLARSARALASFASYHDPLLSQTEIESWGPLRPQQSRNVVKGDANENS